MSTQVKPIKVFYSYAHKDEGLRRELDAALAVLRRNGVIQDWSDRSILPGATGQRRSTTNLPAQTWSSC